MAASNEVTFLLSWTAVYLLIFIGISLIQSGIILARKRAKKYVDTKPKQSPIFKPVRRMLDPNVIWMKVPFFILLFAVTGVLEAYLRYVEGASDESLFTFGAISVFFIYLAMLALVREDRFTVTFSILMGGLLAVFVAHYVTSLILIDYLGVTTLPEMVVII